MKPNSLFKGKYTKKALFVIVPIVLCAIIVCVLIVSLNDRNAQTEKGAGGENPDIMSSERGNEEDMDKLYKRINFENAPSQKTPLNEENLNKMDSAIDELDDRVIQTYDELNGTLSEMYRKNLIDGVRVANGYVDTTGAFNSSSSYVALGDTVEVTPGTTLTTSRVRFVTFYTGTGTQDKTNVGGLAFPSPYETTQQFVVPDNANLMIITFYAADYNNGICYCYENENGFMLSDALYNDIVGIIKDVSSKKLDGITIYNFGDSIGAGDGNNGYGYAEMLTEYGATVVDYAEGGATLSRVEGQSMGSILNQIENASSTVPDLILLEGGANDYTNFREHGAMTPYYTFDATDETTYIGALESALNKLMNKYKYVPIIWICTHQENTRHSKTDGSTTVDFKEMHDLSVDVCKKWAIPVVDLFNDGGLNANISFMRSKYTYNGDGTHPNEEGYRKFYVPAIISKIKEIMAID